MNELTYHWLEPNSVLNFKLSGLDYQLRHWLEFTRRCAAFALCGDIAARRVRGCSLAAIGAACPARTPLPGTNDTLRLKTLAYAEGANAVCPAEGILANDRPTKPSKLLSTINEGIDEESDDDEYLFKSMLDNGYKCSRILTLD